jgi:hypothetical protein
MGQANADRSRHSRSAVFSNGGDIQLAEIDSLGAPLPVAVFHAADNSLVAEVKAPIANDALLRLVRNARARGVHSVWVIGRRFSGGGLSFSRRRGYARLQAVNPLQKLDAAQPPRSLVPKLQTACRSGVWGHHLPASEPDPDATHVGLYEAGAWVGICEVDVESNGIDSPGLIASCRTADRYARLVREASSMLAPGPVTLETWGDSETILDAYRALGFVLVEYVPGWELVL